MNTATSRFPLTIKQCRVIREIMKKGTEKGAGTSLNLSQSSVSRALSQAEHTLEVNIFTRGWSGAYCSRGTSDFVLQQYFASNCRHGT